jgi:eukaryotic-like serine/threonine-protein kinase
LDRFLSNRPIQARPTGIPERVWRWSRRNPLVAGFCAAFAGLLLMLAWAALIQREYAMIDVKEAAFSTARLVDAELKPVKSALHELASDPRLNQHILQRDTNALSVLLQSHLQNQQPRTPTWLRFQNWLVISPEGTVILRWPEAEKNVNRQCAVRDYFQGAIAASNTNSVYISRAYQSVDDHHYKFALSKRVTDTNQNVAGVLALMVSPTDLANQALGPRSGGREIAIVAEWDSSQAGPTVGSLVPRGPREFRIVFHPTYKTENLAVPMAHPHLYGVADSDSLDPLGDSFYRDPLARAHSKYRGWWMAGFAKVPDSKLVVIYQTRDWVIDALAIAGAVSALLTAGLVLSWRLKRRRAARSAANQKG